MKKHTTGDEFHYKRYVRHYGKNKLKKYSIDSFTIDVSEEMTLTLSTNLQYGIIMVIDDETFIKFMSTRGGFMELAGEFLTRGSDPKTPQERFVSKGRHTVVVLTSHGGPKPDLFLTTWDRKKGEMCIQYK